MAPQTLTRDFTLSCLAEEIGSHIPAVVKILADRNGECISVWTVVEPFERSAREEVYRAEEHLMELHPDIKFDFHVVMSHHRSEPPQAALAYAR